MPDALTEGALEELLARLPSEHDGPDDIARRVRFETSEGRTVFAFVRAGAGKLGFAGWEAKSGRAAEDEWEYFVLGAEKPGDPLQLINKNGPLGIVVEAELEDRGS
ncbi:MAG TPA: hypothetical protein VFK90_13925 [Anaeromyxobacter sp.]|nr:hypothetical protein [Anaeromyxobacter sp.]